MGKKKSSPNRTPPEGAVDAAPATAAEFRRRAKPFMDVLSKEATTDQERANQLRAYHRLGSLSLEIVSGHEGYGKGLLEDHAKAVGRPYGFISVARRFAASYNNADLDQLCKRPLGVSHLRALVDVTNKSQRATLQKQAYDDKLSVAALFELKKQRFGRKRSGGAPIKVPDDPRIAVLELLGDGDKWVRRCEATIPKLTNVGGKRVPADLKEVAEEGIERLKALGKAVRQAEKELRRVSDDA
jgi:hypothetical protein